VEVGALALRLGRHSASSLGLHAYWAFQLGDPNRAIELALEGAAVGGDELSTSICLVW